MPRLPLGQLEVALANPGAFRHSMESGAGARFGETYGGALRQAIERYHRTGRGVEAYRYLDARLQASRFLRNRGRKQETLEHLEWYTTEHQRLGWPTFEWSVRVVVPLPATAAAADLTCSGEITRIDLNPRGGYAAWIASTAIDPEWHSEMRFPLIQHAVADSILAVQADEVSVGVYDLSHHRTEHRTFTPEQLRAARRRFRGLISALGYSSPA